MAEVFRFRLERVLRLRRLQEQVCRRDLARAQAAVMLQTRVVERLRDEERQGKDALRRMKMKTLDLERLRLQDGYLEFLARRILAALERLQELRKVETEKRAALAEAARKVKVLERLRERRHAAHLVELDRGERIFLDEVAQNAAHPARTP